MSSRGTHKSMPLISEMDADSVVGYFTDKNIIITGSTGFLGKALVEKILRVQPDVKKLFLLIQASDVESAKLRIKNEVTRKEIFQMLKEKHSVGFDNFIEGKICPLVGDIMYEKFGLDTAKLTQLSKDIDIIIINGAATTKFSERYDVAFNTNVLGTKHVCAFGKKCTKLKMLVHVSTAYVAGEQVGIIPEKPILMSETLRVGTYFDIESELNMIEETRIELRANSTTEKAERKNMKELGLKRARHFGWPNTYVFTKAMGEMLLGQQRGNFPVVIIRPSMITSILKEPLPGWMEGIRKIDSVVIAYAKQSFSFFLADLNLIMDVIPVDMVVNAMMVSMAAHSEELSQIIYHVTSSQRNQASYSVLSESGHRYFFDNPQCTKRNGEHIPMNKMRFFSTVPRLRLYMGIKYKLPLEMRFLANIVLCGVFSRRYQELSKIYRFVVQLIELYAPFALFKGCFDDMNLEKLRMAMNKEKNNNGASYFNFDPKSINWDDYFYNVHIPGVLKYRCDGVIFN